MNDRPVFDSYPLRWPEHQPRKARELRKRGPFGVTLGRARDDLMKELKLLHARNIVVTSDLPTRRDGLPYAGAPEPRDPGVAVYFDRKGRPFVFACDSYDRFVQNLRAVGQTIAALRAIDRYGASEMLEQAFTGFAALPAAHREKPWWEVLGVEETASREIITAAYRGLAVLHHPDRGGFPARMAEINVARDEAMAARSNGVGI